MDILRRQEPNIDKFLRPGKVVLLLGARRTGKTWLIRKWIDKQTEMVRYFNGDDITTLEAFERRSAENYKNILGASRLLVIDEAQRIPDLGSKLKLMIDEIPGLRILISGSSAYDLSAATGEPLTGRKQTLYLYSLSESELKQTGDYIYLRENLRERLVFGNYPELIHLAGRKEKQEYLREIVNSYLLKDILQFDGVRNSDKLLRLLKLIAFQTGSEVSFHELATQLSLSKNTVEKYLDLLAKSFVIFQVGAFSRNLRREVSKAKKWYFCDVGIRNALINDLRGIDSRDDIGKLWENYIIAERIKQQEYNRDHKNNYFWRIYDAQELDWIEEADGKIRAYEFKWKEAKTKVPPAFQGAYPDAEMRLITSANYQEWLAEGD